MLSVEKQLLFLLSSRESVDVKQLVAIYEARGISHQLIRNALTRLKKDGYIESPARSSYAITGQGRTFLGTINRKPLLYGQPWDRKWHWVLFEIPESERSRRDVFRSSLLELGYASLYKSVYLSPWDHAREALELAAAAQVQSYVTITEGSILHNEITPEQAVQLWRLDHLHQTYGERVEWFRAEFQPKAAKLLQADPEDGLPLFAAFLELGDVNSELGLLDPMLPDELLPSGWLGKSFLLEVREALIRIASAIPASSAYKGFVNGLL
ncbi:PaaX family transcriptional regulator C-terminal domain-containing protein [Paenibacillus pinistramenti]|uniref:PaaX family transcriptional regulator C-terminal domain-containing protein n=1 Tax=Paenibacillus pinistramenti TaxID=1768003 RepID=UPI00110A01F5|nr:PaaX family transcriptional regulator C-terminal domain-containing protein [Paenibacillus pinistramenti]